ncbi:MAG: hypothetical protein K0R39_3272 [Symbiobacteriaceae bacterium]|jgi:hypothetical protein|nr:hypothetical protein [Symbiobacteriaceae bacterium]
METVLTWFQNLNNIERLFLGLNLTVVLVGLRGVSLVAKTYGSLTKDLENVRQNGQDAATHPVLRDAFFDYHRILGRFGGRVHEGVIVARALQGLRTRPGGARVEAWVRFVRTAISLCLVLGLIGTFTGLTQALFGLSGSLAEAAANAGDTKEMTGLLDQLREMLGGMSTVFQASLWGVGGSALLTLISAIWGTFSIGDRTAAELEHYFCHEYVARREANDGEDLQRQVLEQLSILTDTLRAGLTSGLSDAAALFAQTASRMGDILQQVQPITSSLDASGSSLRELGTGLSQVTGDMRDLMMSLKLTQGELPKRMEKLHEVESALLVSFDALQSSMAGSLKAYQDLVRGADLFHAGADTLQGTVRELKEAWPGIVQEFITRTESAVESQAVTVCESVDQLREVLEQSRRDSLEQMEQMVEAQTAFAKAAASSMGR